MPTGEAKIKTLPTLKEDNFQISRYRSRALLRQPPPQQIEQSKQTLPLRRDASRYGRIRIYNPYGRMR